jgi:hypothetical protein
MTLDEIKKRVGKNIKYYSGTDGWITDRDVTEDDIQDFVNEIYTEEMFPLFAMRWPHLFRQVGTMDSWLMTSTVSDSSTSTSLVIEDASFTNSMEDLRVYNSTDDEYTTIESYSNTTTVTVEDTIGDTWDGDTIYVIGQEFGFGGEATDLFSVERVYVKYDTDDDYQTAEMVDKQDLFVSGDEEGSEGRPYAYHTTITDDGDLYSGIGIFPALEDYISDAIKIEYISKPSAILVAGTTPVIPIQSSLIAGATMRAYEMKQDLESATYWRNRFEVAKKQEISRFRPNMANVPAVKLKASRRVADIHQRRI